MQEGVGDHSESDNAIIPLPKEPPMKVDSEQDLLDHQESTRIFSPIDWRLRKYELVLVAFGLMTCALVFQTSLPFSEGLVGYFFLRLAKFVGLVYGVSLFISVGKAVIWVKDRGKGDEFTRQTLLSFLDPYWTLNYLQLTVRRGIAILGTVYFFLHLKHIILWIHPANYDLFFWQLDKKLHFGVQPNVWLMTNFGLNHDFAIFIDWIYFAYFSFLIIAAVVFLLEIKGRELTEKFFLAYTLLWSFGGLCYFIMPADGPCYAILGPHSVAKKDQQHVFSFPVTHDVPKEYIENYQQSKIWNAKNYQEELWTQRRNFLMEESLPGRFYGIAAMPSLHVAAVTMVTIFFFQLGSLAGIVATVLGSLFAMTIFIGSVFLQWHYAVDGYAGILLAAAVCYLSLKFGGSRQHQKQLAPSGHTIHSL